MDTINVLLTGCGAPGTPGTIYCLHNNEDNRHIRIVGTDMREDKAGQYLCDEFYKVPDPTDPKYKHIIMRICEREKIHVVLCQTTNELRPLAELKKVIGGTKIAVSDADVIDKANNKAKLYEIAREAYVPVPEHTLIHSFNELYEACIKLGFPEKKVVIKPPISNGSRGLRIIVDKYPTGEEYLKSKPDGIHTTLDAFSHIRFGTGFPELLVMEYLEGDEYTVDCFVDNSSFVIPRIREKIINGISWETSVKYNPFIMNYSHILSNELNLKYAFGFQFIEDKLIECNPRIQGTMVASYFAGYNIIYNTILTILNKPSKANKWFVNKTKFKRYWGGIAIENGKIKDKI